MTLPTGSKVPAETTALGIERIVWHNEITKGIFHKHIVEIERITNYRVIQNNSEILLKDVDDIVVMNQHRVSQSSHVGTYTGRYTRFGYGTSSSTGVSIGDMVFMHQGRPYIIFRQITDPNGVARLAKSARKQLLEAIKATKKLQAQAQSQQQQVREMTIKRDIENISISKNDVVNCPRCSGSNPEGSKYCNKCGFRIDNKIASADARQPSSPVPTAANAMIKQISDGNELRYISPVYKIEMDYPFDWTIVEEGLPKDLVVGFTPPKDDVYDPYLENVVVGILQSPKQVTLDQFVQLIIKENPNFKIQESSQTSLCSMPAHKIVYDDQGMRHLWTILVKPNESSNNNTVYIIQYIAKIDRYALYLPIALKMINSFRSTDK